MKLTKKHIFLVKYIIIAFLFALFAEYLGNLDIYKVFSLIDSDIHRHSYGIQSLHGKNMEVEENGHTICGDKPSYRLDGFQIYIDTIEIRMRNLSSSSLPVKIYVSNDGENYSEDPVSSFLYPDNCRAVFAKIEKQSIVSVRVKIGEKQDEYDMDYIVLNPRAKDYLKAAVYNMNIVRVFVYIIIFALLVFVLKDYRKLLQMLFTYRWWIGISIIALCTILNLNGSSIGSLVTGYLEGYDSSLVWGSFRGIRSDEFVAFTQMALSQSKSGFHWMSPIWGYSPRDMFIVYGQPIMDLVTLYRPFTIGYILFGAERGLAFYWSARMVILFLVSFEFGRLITKDERKLSSCYALLISLAPVIQWWFSVNEYVEMLIFVQASVLVLKCFFQSCSFGVKICCSAALALCAGGFILALYPAWMMPMLYLLLACMASMLIENRKNIFERIHICSLKRNSQNMQTVKRNRTRVIISAKKIVLIDVLILFIAIVVVGLSLFYILHYSSGTIDAVMNTAYPGERRYVGNTPAVLVDLFKGWTSWLWTFIETENSCGYAEFMNFFPVGIILSAVVFLIEKKRDIWLIMLNLISILLMLYMFFEVSEEFSEATLLGWSSGGRMINIIGIAQVMILIRAMAVMNYHKRLYLLLVPGSVLFCVIGTYTGGKNMTPQLRWMTIFVGVIIVFLITNYKCGKEIWKYLFLSAVLLLSVVGGALVNPVNQGLGSVYNNNIVQAMDNINKDQPGTWAVNGAWALSNLPTVVGAKSITALETYPDKKFWEDLGLAEYEDYWNRYAHIEMIVTDNPADEAPEASKDGQTSLKVTFVDSLALYITVDKLREIGVDYILSRSDLSDFDGVDCIYQYPGKSCSIWKII